jgi:hypothetical protein
VRQKQFVSTRLSDASSNMKRGTLVSIVYFNKLILFSVRWREGGEYFK